MAVDKLVDSTVLDGYFEDIADAIRGKNGSSDTYTPAQMPQAITDIPSGGGGGPVEEKDVNFIDYDGTIVYSYTKSEFLELTEMPANPSHDGLIAQGWNWTLSDAKSYVQSYGGQIIGQQYITNDGCTRAYISVEKGLLSIVLGVYLNGSMLIDWGDGSENTITGSSTSSKTDTTHTYDEPGEYIISLTITGTAIIRGQQYSNYSEFIHGTLNNESYNYVYMSMIKKLELGSNVSLGIRAFANAVNLETVTVPKTLNLNAQYCFDNCPRLYAIVISESTSSLTTSALRYSIRRYISLSKSISTILSQALQGVNCNKLYLPDSITLLDSQVLSGTKCELIVIPNSVTTLYSSVCNNSYNLTKIHISPNIAIIKSSFLSSDRCLAYLEVSDSVTTIESSAFSGLYGLKEIHFKSIVPPTVSNSNVFSGIPNVCKIYVPSGYLSAYTSATNYPSSTTYTYVEE